MHVALATAAVIPEAPGVGVSSRMGACMRIEGNTFQDVYQPIMTNHSGDTLDTLEARVFERLSGKVERMDDLLSILQTPTADAA